MAFPNIGDKIPPFEAMTQKGMVGCPSFIEGHWSIIFAHPANFSSAWTMYSTFLSMKERWFVDRNTKLLAICNEPLGQSEFTELVRRYIGIFLKAPVVEDLDYRVAHILGIASGRKKHIEHDRIAYVVDPECVVRLILYNHLKPTVEHAILQLTTALDNLQRNIDPLVSIELPLETAGILKNNEQSDLIDNYKPKPAYFRRDKINPN
ncbi:MAG: hypothetical protein RIR11_240 [Bacteroidota bacterium]|jgi:peroxiredoxin (alkyl hydroperoxide reductase subunit C)